MRNTLFKRYVLAFTLWTGVFILSFFPFTWLFVRAEKSDFGWKKLASYVTYFREEEKDRRENIHIAASLIDGIVLQAYGDFSFNQTVGKRTEEAGFKQAKIIVKGEYVLGVGGGVCQVSTTLYNAALLTGLEVKEFHPHSLQVGYVPPSRDAMVSSHSDLRLFNPYDFPVLLQAKTFEGGLRVSFLGEGKIDEYAVISHSIAQIPPPPPVIKTGEREEVLRFERAGLKSEAYLERRKKGVLLSKKKLRMDEYLPTQAIIVKKIDKPHD